MTTQQDNYEHSNSWLSPWNGINKKKWNLCHTTHISTLYPKNSHNDKPYLQPMPVTWLLPTKISNYQNCTEHLMSCIIMELIKVSHQHEELLHSPLNNLERACQARHNGEDSIFLNGKPHAIKWLHKPQQAMERHFFTLNIDALQGTYEWEEKVDCAIITSPKPCTHHLTYFANSVNNK